MDSHAPCRRRLESRHHGEGSVMPRTRTDAAERARQRRAVAKQVSAELGVPVGVDKARDHRRAQKASPIPGGVPYRVTDRVVCFEAADCRRVGQVLARVVDYKILSAGLAQLSLQTSGDEFAHTLTDAAIISRAHPLLVTLDELFPLDGGDAG